MSATSYRRVLRVFQARKNDVSFVPEEVDADEASYWSSITVSRKVWEEMGEPLQITMSIEPGDHGASDQELFRDAGTGRFITEGEALESPGTTIQENG